MTELLRRIAAVNKPNDELPAGAPCSFEELAAADIPIEKVPPSVYAEIAAPLEAIFERIAMHPEQPGNWWLLAAFPKLVLHRLDRGGSRHNHHAVLTLRTRCQHFVNGRFQILWDGAKKARDDAIRKRQESRQKHQRKKKFLVDDIDSRFSLGLSTDVCSIDDLDAELAGDIF